MRIILPFSKKSTLMLEVLATPALEYFLAELCHTGLIPSKPSSELSSVGLLVHWIALRSGVRNIRPIVIAEYSLRRVH